MIFTDHTGVAEHTSVVALTSVSDPTVISENVPVTDVASKISKHVVRNGVKPLATWRCNLPANVSLSKQREWIKSSGKDTWVQI